MLKTHSGIAEVCAYLFKNDSGEPLRITTYQSRIIFTIFWKEPKKTICTASTRAGKSLAVAIGCILLAVFRPEKIRIIAPTDEHTRIIMNYIIQHILDNDFCREALLFNTEGMGVEKIKKELTKQKLTFKNGSEIMTLSANIGADGRSLIGWGASAVICDEGENIPVEIMRTKVMRMLGDSPDSSIFIIGNPSAIGYMYEKSTDPDWSFMRVDWRECVKEGRLTQEFIDERKRELTELEFGIWYDARWPEEFEDQFFSHDELGNLFAPLADEERKLLEYEPDEKYLGVDVARLGFDLTVLTQVFKYGEKYFIVGIDSFEKKDLMDTVGRIVNLDKEENFGRINIDSIGLGAGVYDRLKEIEGAGEKAREFVAGQAPSREKEKYINKKAQQYSILKRMLKNCQIRNACENAGKLHNEMKKIKFEFQSTGKMRIVDPEEKSPDFADSLVIAMSDTGFRFAFV